MVKLEISAPGAKLSPQFVLACIPVAGFAPTVSSWTHPVSLLPCLGHITSLAVSCAETGEIISRGDIKETNISSTRKMDFLEFEIVNRAVPADFITIVAFLTLFERGPISCAEISL